MDGRWSLDPKATDEVEPRRGTSIAIDSVDPTLNLRADSGKLERRFVHICCL